MVEVSVVLAEALLLQKEGTALRDRCRRQQLRREVGGGGGGRRGKDSNNSDDHFSSIPRTATPPATAGAAEGEADADADMVDRCWNDEKAAENQRRVDVLSESLEASDIHDLQVLRRSLQHQVDDTANGTRRRRGRSRGERSSALADRSLGQSVFGGRLFVKKTVFFLL